MLTVYRHFESASVHRGLLGTLPKTQWVIDYPLFERIYYALVAGFDVYGTVGHQLALRNYMDELRVEGESYFLDFMPPAQRQEIMQSWYKGVDLKKMHYYPTALPSKISFVTADPKREFIEAMVNNHFAPAAKIGFDPVNYLHAGEVYPGLPEKCDSPIDYLRAFRALSQPGMPFLAVIHALSRHSPSENVLYARSTRPSQLNWKRLLIRLSNTILKTVSPVQKR